MKKAGKAGRWFVNITSTLAAHPGGKALIIYRDEAYTRESKLFGHCLSGGRDRSPRPQDLARVAAYADQEQACGFPKKHQKKRPFLLAHPPHTHTHTQIAGHANPMSPLPSPGTLNVFHGDC